MPLTAKGEKIKSALTKEYGEKKGESVLYAGKNKGTFTGIDEEGPAGAAGKELPNLDSLMDSVSNLAHQFDAMCDAEKKKGAALTDFEKRIEEIRRGK